MWGHPWQAQTLLGQYRTGLEYGAFDRVRKGNEKKKKRSAGCCPNPCFAMRYSKHYSASNNSTSTGISDSDPTRVCIS